MTKFKFHRVVILIFLVLQTFSAKAEYAYFGLEPDIVTNYIGASNRDLGYIRVSVELMLEDAAYLDSVTHHAPLLRSLTIDIFGRQPADKIKSLTGREEIRQICLSTLREQLKKETGSEMIKDIIFTKYLYQG
ncbi:flagellar basal body-associated protein FliL [Neptunicella sp. SCSIO 80796]|uniref:flagellar basal body-associated protein FliL n=1 Tax=Neptunicella plasticusilytica TaxID=3117012 RepID=UPI003A4D86BC